MTMYFAIILLSSPTNTRICMESQKACGHSPDGIGLPPHYNHTVRNHSLQMIQCNLFWETPLIRRLYWPVRLIIFYFPSSICQCLIFLQWETTCLRDHVLVAFEQSLKTGFTVYPIRCNLHRDLTRLKVKWLPNANQTLWDIICIFYKHSFSLLYHKCHFPPAPHGVSWFRWKERGHFLSLGSFSLMCLRLRVNELVICNW